MVSPEVSEKTTGTTWHPQPGQGGIFFSHRDIAPSQKRLSLQMHKQVDSVSMSTPVHQTATKKPLGILVH